MKLWMSMMRTAWAMTERSMKVGIAVLSRDQYFAEARKQALESRQGAPLKNAKTTAVRGGVAIIPIAGVLFRRADAFEELCGGASATYAAIMKDLQAALDDPQVRAIMLDIDSPGGEVDGCGELANAIFRARAQKDVVAYVGGMGASAAYWLASAASKVVCAPTAELGSIGVRSGYVDDRRALESMGFKEWVFVSSQSPKKGFDPELDADRARLQVILDDLADVFVEAVALHRGVTAKAVLEKFGQGDVMVGQRAVEAGLADEIGTYEATLADMVSRHTPGARDMFSMQAIGLAEDATEQEATARVEALVAFEKQVMSATGAATADESRGKLAAAINAERELERLRPELAAMAATVVRRDGIAALGRMDAKGVRAMAPFLVSNEAARAEVFKAIEAADDKDESVFEAFFAVPGITAGDVQAMEAFAAKNPRRAAAEPIKAPKRTDDKDSVALSDEDAKYCERYGIDPAAMIASKNKRAAQ